jgi:hypothetical protein
MEKRGMFEYHLSEGFLGPLVKVGILAIGLRKDHVIQIKQRGLSALFIRISSAFLFPIKKHNAQHPS